MVEDINICVCFQDPTNEPNLGYKDHKTDEKEDSDSNIIVGTLLDYPHISWTKENSLNLNWLKEMRELSILGAAAS